ncbi:hypothetical protein F4825DRAFT_425637 [Nemania diffusa]|nr:hypothetical protein F4825DRAFT_425637 [Nemania diffusa]
MDILATPTPLGDLPTTLTSTATSLSNLTVATSGLSTLTNATAPVTPGLPTAGLSLSFASSLWARANAITIRLPVVLLMLAVSALARLDHFWRALLAAPRLVRGVAVLVSALPSVLADLFINGRAVSVPFPVFAARAAAGVALGVARALAAFVADVMMWWAVPEALEMPVVEQGVWRTGRTPRRVFAELCFWRDFARRAGEGIVLGAALLLAVRILCGDEVCPCFWADPKVVGQAAKGAGRPLAYRFLSDGRVERFERDW